MDKKIKEENPEVFYKIFEEISKIKIDIEIIKRDVKWLKYMVYFIVFLFSVALTLVRFF